MAVSVIVFVEDVARSLASATHLRVRSRSGTDTLFASGRSSARLAAMECVARRCGTVTAS
jgi:hypothetical protein